MKHSSSTNSLIGIDVVNEYEIRMGCIEDLIANLQTRQLEYVLVSAGHLLGMEDELYAIPARYLVPCTEERALMFQLPPEPYEVEELPLLPGSYRHVDVCDLEDFVLNIVQAVEKPGRRTDINVYEQ